MTQPLRLVTQRRLVELGPTAQHPALMLAVRIVDSLECGHELTYFTESYQPRAQRRCAECAGDPAPRVR